MSNDVDSGYSKSSIAIMILLAALPVISYGLFIIYKVSPISNYTIQNAGVFGDSFGVLTSFFSALAFGGVVLTLRLQNKSLLLQRQELSAQKEELNATRYELTKQGFESSFFQMLKLHNQIVEGISVSKRGHEEVIFDGRNGLKMAADRLKRLLKLQGADKHSDEDIVLEAYSNFVNEYGHQLAHYFRFLYNIFRYLSESKVEGKELYVRLLRAQLSNQELLIIYYNALSEYGLKFQAYIIEFNLMDNLPRADLVNVEHVNFISDAWRT